MFTRTVFICGVVVKIASKRVGAPLNFQFIADPVVVHVIRATAIAIVKFLRECT